MSFFSFVLKIVNWVSFNDLIYPNFDFSFFFFLFCEEVKMGAWENK